MPNTGGGGCIELVEKMYSNNSERERERGEARENINCLEGKQIWWWARVANKTSGSTTTALIDSRFDLDANDVMGTFAPDSGAPERDRLAGTLNLKLNYLSLRNKVPGEKRRNNVIRMNAVWVGFLLWWVMGNCCKYSRRGVFFAQHML